MVAIEAPMELVRTEFRAMGSQCEIVAAGANIDAVRHAMGMAAREVVRIEHKYSRYRNDNSSIIYRINAAAGSGIAVQCDAESTQLFNLAASFHALSAGLFDITAGVLRHVWNFSGSEIPSAADLAPLLPLIGWNKVEFNQDSVLLPLPGMELDLGGIGKEYAADCAAGVMLKHGISHGYVNLGGDICVFGPRINGEPWRFGVQNPRDADAVVANIELRGGALVTSGDYVKFIEKNGVRFSHILNPKTGLSVSCWRSVSVVGVSSVIAGAYSTIAMLKEDQAVNFLNQVGCRYLLIGNDGGCIAGQNYPDRSIDNADNIADPEQ